MGRRCSPAASAAGTGVVARAKISIAQVLVAVLLGAVPMVLPVPGLRQDQPATRWENALRTAGG